MFFFPDSSGTSTELAISDSTTTLIPNVTAQMLMSYNGSDLWVDGVLDQSGKMFISTEDEVTYPIYEPGETTKLRYVNLQDFTRMSELDHVVGFVNSLADERAPSTPTYTSKDLVSVNGDVIQHKHGGPAEAHRNSLFCLRYLNSLVASNSTKSAEQASALAMIGFANGVYPGSKIETDGARAEISGQYDMPFISATDGHILRGQLKSGMF